MTTLNKILIAIVAVLLLAGLITIGVFEYELKTQQATIQQSVTEMKQLQDQVARSQSQYVTQATLDQTAKNLGFKMDDIKDDMNKLGVSVAAINNITTTTPGFVGTNLTTHKGSSAPTVIPSELTCTNGKCPNPDIYGYLNNEQTLTLTEPFNSTTNIPFGSTSFKAWQEKPWGLTVLPRSYSATTIVATDADGKMQAYNQFSVKVDGKTYNLPIEDAKLVQKVPTATWSWWNPKLFITTGGAVKVTNVPPVKGEFDVGMTFGFMSYGKMKASPDISVLQLGVGYEVVDKSPSVIINPVNFNIGHVIPGGFISNTYIGPSVQVDLHGNVMTGLNLSLGL